MKFTNNNSHNVCWRGINVFPGQTVEDKSGEESDKPKKTRKVK